MGVKGFIFRINDGYKYKDYDLRTVLANYTTHGILCEKGKLILHINKITTQMT